MLADGFLLASIFWAFRHDIYIAQIVSYEIVAIMAVSVLVAGLLLPLVCTWLSVGHFLRMREAEMYR